MELPTQINGTIWMPAQVESENGDNIFPSTFKNYP